MFKLSTRVLRLLLVLSFAVAVFQLVLISPASVSAANGGWLHTSGNKILNASNQVVGISGVNWFGFETGTGAPDGLSTQSWWFFLDQMKAEGYNTIRIPFSNQVLDPGHMPQSIDYNQKNPDLIGLNSLQMLDKIIDGARQRGLKIILDNHRSNDGVSAQESGLWYTAAYPESRWISDWQFLTNRYKNDDTVVGMDLRNEPHDAACWGCGDPLYDWRLAAEKAGNAILAINSNLLIFVEGVECFGLNGANVPPMPDQPNPNNVQCTWWGGNVMGAKDYPVRLSVANRLVYSPHEYPASVYAQPWFSDPTYPANMPAVWEKYWGYLITSNTAPLMFGEFGSRLATASDRTWFTAFTDYIRTKGLSWTYWSWNPNSGDTGGIVMDDWATVIRAKQDVLDTIQYPLLGATPTPTPTRADGGLDPDSMKVQYRAADAAASTANVKPYLRIVNVSAGTVDLSKVKVRYYLTKDSTGNLDVFCDWATLSTACTNITRTSGVISGTNADSYIEIGFTAGAGTLLTNQSINEIQLRATKSDFLSFTQTNDYSFDATKTAYGDNNKITLYYNGVLIWGTPPSGVTITNTPSIPTNTIVPPTTTVPTRVPTTAVPTTTVPTRVPTTVPTTAVPTRVPTTAVPTRVNTAVPTTAVPTRVPTTAVPTRVNTAVPTTAVPTRIPTTAVPGGLTVQITKGADIADNTQVTKAYLKITNTGTTSLSNISFRVYFTADGSNAVSGYALDKYWDQSNFATVSAPTQCGTTPNGYFTVNYGTASLAAGASWQFNTAIHLSNWSTTHSGANDYFRSPYPVGAIPDVFTNTANIPAYIGGVLNSGTPQC